MRSKFADEREEPTTVCDWTRSFGRAFGGGNHSNLSSLLWEKAGDKFTTSAKRTFFHLISSVSPEPEEKDRLQKYISIDLMVLID
jgi:hypothetical protein